MNTTMEILSVIIAAISGGILTQFVNLRKVKTEVQKVVADYYKEEIKYLVGKVKQYQTEVNAYKEENEKLLTRLNILEDEIRRLKTSSTKASTKKKPTS